jgi:hypothetical protein
MGYNSTSLLRSVRHYGTLFPQSRSCKVPGKPSGTMLASRPIEQQSTMDLQSSASTIRGSTKSPPMSLCLVRLSSRSELLNAFHLLTSIALHPYFKLAYIEIAWGGPAEQEAKRNSGNPHAKDWQDEARKILERMVCTHSLVGSAYLTYIGVTDGALLQEPAQSETDADSSPR